MVKYVDRVLKIPVDLTDESGVGEKVEADKCDSHWTDRECPAPPTCAEYHFGQFGHKVMFLFCDRCYLRVLAKRSSSNGPFLFTHEADGRGFEIYENSQLNEIVKLPEALSDQGGNNGA